MKAYQNFATFYDFLMKDAPYDKWVTLIDVVIETLAYTSQEVSQRPLKIVDIGCGTGTLCTMVADKGHQVWGIDISESMLSIAEEKRSQMSLPMRRKINFLCEDMKQLHLPETMDVAYSFCDSINYLGSVEDVDSTFKQVYKNLQPGGLFVFDLLSLHKMINQLHDFRSFEVSDEVISIWQNSWDSLERELHYDVSVFTREHDGRYCRFDEYHIQKGFSIKEIRELLNHNHFEIVKEFADFVIEKPIGEAIDRYFWIVKKV